MSIATIGDTVMARKSAYKAIRVHWKSCWKITRTTESNVEIVRGKVSKQLSYDEVSKHFDLLAQISRIQIIK